MPASPSPVSPTASSKPSATSPASHLGAALVGHVGDGNFHMIFPVNPDDPADLDEAERLTERLVERTLAMGGTCSGEHGVGLGKKKFLAREHGEALERHAHDQGGARPARDHESRARCCRLIPVSVERLRGIDAASRAVRAATRRSTDGHHAARVRPRDRSPGPSAESRKAGSRASARAPARRRRRRRSPMIVSFNAWPMTSFRTCDGVAPSASRIPTSVVRSAAISVMTPKTPSAASPSASTPKVPTSSSTNCRDATAPLLTASIVRMSSGGSAPRSRTACLTDAVSAVGVVLRADDEVGSNRRALPVGDVELRLRAPPRGCRA